MKTNTKIEQVEFVNAYETLREDVERVCKSDLLITSPEEAIEYYYTNVRYQMNSVGIAIRYLASLKIDMESLIGGMWPSITINF